MDLQAARGPTFDCDAGHAERRRWIQGLANLPVLEHARTDTVSAFVTSARFRRHRRGTVIYREGEPAEGFFLLIEGTVRIFQTHASGSQYTPKIFRAPAHFGDLAVLSSLGRYQSSVEALDDCVVAFVPTNVLEQVLREDPELCRGWLYSVARQHALSIDSDRQSVFGGLAARVANLLLSYAEVFGSEHREWIALEQPLSYARLARETHCTRRGAIALSQRMVSAGLLTVSGGRWLVSPQRLRAMLLPGRLGLSHSMTRRP